MMTNHDGTETLIQTMSKCFCRRGGRGCPMSGLWPFVGRYTSCSAPYPLAGGRDGHEGPPQGGGSEPNVATALLGLWLVRDKDAPCAGEGTAVHGAPCAQCSARISWSLPASSRHLGGPAGTPLRAQRRPGHSQASLRGP